MVKHETDFYLKSYLDWVLEVFSLIKNGLLLTVIDSNLLVDILLEIVFVTSPDSTHDLIFYNFWLSKVDGLSKCKLSED